MSKKTGKNESLHEKLSIFDQLMLFGSDRPTAIKISNTLAKIRITSLLVFIEYEKLKDYTQQTNQLSILLRCILTNNSQQVSELKEPAVLSKIFKNEYNKFLTAMEQGKSLGQSLIRKVTTEEKVDLVYNAIVDGSSDLYNHIDYAISFVDNYFIKQLLSDDSKITEELKKKYSNPIFDMNSKRNQKLVNSTIREVTFIEKIKILKNSFDIVENNLATFLISKFPKIKQIIMKQFISDKHEVYEKMNLVKYDSELSHLIQHKNQPKSSLLVE